MKLVATIILLLFFASCATTRVEKMNESSYRNWLTSNTQFLTDTLTVNQIFYGLREYPFDIDYLNSRESEKELAEVQKEVLERQQVRYALKLVLPERVDIYHFHAESSNEERVKYYAFHLNEAFKIVTETNDTIKSSRAEAEQAISGYPTGLMLIEFEGVPRKAIRTILFEDKYLSGTTVVFDISKFARINPPKLIKEL